MIKNYFDNNPDHILGDLKKVSGKYGPETAVVSTLSVIDIAKKIIGNNNIPKLHPFVINTQVDNKVSNSTLIESIEKTKKEQQSHPPSTGYDIIPFDELQKRYSNVSEPELRAWVYYNRNRLFSIQAIGDPSNGWNKYATEPTQDELRQWVESGIMVFDGKEYVPEALFYAGNIYEKIKTIEARKFRIIDVVGEPAYTSTVNKLLEAVPEKLTLQAVDGATLHLSPIDPFVSRITINELSDNTIFETDITLLQAFTVWLDNVPAEMFASGSREFEIVNYYLGNTRFKKDTEESERIEIRRRAQQDCMNLFAYFLKNMLTRVDQQIVETQWNMEYNAFKEFDYSRIPIGMEINRYFKNSLIDPRKTLWDGVKFLTTSGSGIIAFDVGVGKTMASILAMAQAMYSGQCKRPLVIVPNPTYYKWIEECIGKWEGDKCIINGILPQFKDRINDFHNLGVSIIDNAIMNWPKDYTITFCTYEALNNIGFSRNKTEQLRTQLFKILNQGDLKERDQSKLMEDIDSILGSISAEASLNFDELGFDYIICDEAHNFKKIFTRVKSRKSDEDDDDDKNTRTPYSISSGTPSKRGLKLFAMAQYVLLNNSMRNVVLLTATPFTNSPLEVYSMLSLVAYQHLEKRGINNLIDFFDKFINEEVEFSVTAKGTFEPKAVIKSFNNRIVLQNIIFSSIIYVTGEEANVPRPTKIVYPLLKNANGIMLSANELIDTKLPPTTDQKYWLREIAKFANEEQGNLIETYIPDSYYDDNGRLLGRILIAINLAKNCTLSPYLMFVGGKKGGEPLVDPSDLSFKTFIESSPKLQYVIQCIRSVKQHHEGRNEPMSGQVIYLNLATDYFDFIKMALVEDGFKDNEVAIINGSTSTKMKESIKLKFLSGDIKILIGSATIKEGIDLQNKSTCLYNVVLDFNPTDIKQLEGRIHRQGNQHSYVRIINPLLENSLDVFMFQKLSEKTSRINDIWYRKGRGNVLKLEDMDPNELKLGLMTDPAERVKAEIELEATKLKTELAIAKSNLDKISQAKEAINLMTGIMDNLMPKYEKAKEYLAALKKIYEANIADQELSESKRADWQRRLDGLTKLLATDENSKGIVNRIKRMVREQLREQGEYDYYLNRTINECDDFIKAVAMIEGIEKNILNPKGLTVNDDLEPLSNEYLNELNRITSEHDFVRSEGHYDEMLFKADQEQAERNSQSKSLEYRVEQFTKHNHLLSCLKGIHICSPDNPMIVEVIKDKEVAVPDGDKLKRIRIAKAKAAALKLKFITQKQKQIAA